MPFVIKGISNIFRAIVLLSRKSGIDYCFLVIILCVTDHVNCFHAYMIIQADVLLKLSRSLLLLY